MPSNHASMDTPEGASAATTVTPELTGSPSSSAMGTSANPSLYPSLRYYIPYCLYWLAAVLVTTLYLGANLRNVSDGILHRDHVSDISQAAHEIFDVLKPESKASIPESAKSPAKESVEDISTKTEHRIHSSPSFVLAVLQMISVILISFLWFHAFALKNHMSGESANRAVARLHKLPVYLSIVPALIFVMAMYQAYQPAVFVMALVAILVAAEHYSGLEEQKEQFRRQETKLVEANDALKKTSDEIRQSASVLADVKRGTERMLKSMGLHKYIQNVYQAYRQAETIFAVVRIHDIDDVWWKATPGQDVWQTYFALDKEKPLTLFNALSPSASRKTLKANIVADLPLPGSHEWIRRKSDSSLFQDLLGLAWQLSVLEEARKRFEDSMSVHAWVSRPLCWIHATDRIVFQVLQEEKLIESSVLTLADKDEKHIAEKSQFQRQLDDNLIEWAQDDIRRYIDRASSAEEYIFSVLRYAILDESIGEDGLLTFRRHGSEKSEGCLMRALDALGFQKWIDGEAGTALCSSVEGGKNRVSEMAYNVFWRLINSRLKPDVCPVSMDSSEIVAYHLAFEVL